MTQIFPLNGKSGAANNGRIPPYDFSTHPFFAPYREQTKPDGRMVLLHLPSGRGVDLTADEARAVTVAAVTLSCVMDAMRKDGLPVDEIARTETRLMEQLKKAYREPFQRDKQPPVQATEKKSFSRLDPKQDTILFHLSQQLDGALSVRELAQRTALPPAPFVQAIDELSRSNFIHVRGETCAVLRKEAEQAMAQAAQADYVFLQTMWGERLTAMADEENRARAENPKRLKVATAKVRLSNFAMKKLRQLERR